MSINERIKFIRKDKNLNQKQFASLLGITQSGVSYMEQDGSNVSDSSIKTICSILGLSEDWLRYGTEPMYTKNDTFSLDSFLKSRNATELEIEIIKAYFDLSQDIREAVINHFISRLSPGKEKITVFRAARSDTDIPSGNVEMSASELEKLHNAPTVTSDDEI